MILNLLLKSKETFYKARKVGYNHETDDVVLIEVSYRIVDAVRANDIVTRYGGDEYVIILPNCKSATELEIIATRILEKIQEPYINRNY